MNVIEREKFELADNDDVIQHVQHNATGNELITCVYLKVSFGLVYGMLTIVVYLMSNLFLYI